MQILTIYLTIPMIAGLAAYSIWYYRHRHWLKLLWREADHSGPGRMNAHVFAYIRNGRFA